MAGFPKSSRLILKKDFEAVFKQPRKVSQKNLLALYRTSEHTQARLGIIIKKSVVKLAVRRNRYRRLIRESFRRHQDTLKGLDIIILMRSKCNPNDIFQDDLDKLWLKLSKNDH